MEKCAFEVGSKKFLRILVSNWGIDENLDKITTIEKIPDILENVKVVQRLTWGWLHCEELSRVHQSGATNSLNYWIKRRILNGHHIFSKPQGISKDTISSAPLMAKPRVGELLLVYMVVSEVVISIVLVREKRCIRSPVYYVSKTLLDAETTYPHLKKLALALVIAVSKHRPTFQCHRFV